MLYVALVVSAITVMLLLLARRRALKRPVVFGADVPFTPEARSIIEAAQVEARECGQPYVGPEHLLLAITSNATSPVWTELEPHGVTPAVLRSRVVADLQAQPLPPSTAILPYTSRAWRALKEAVGAAIAARQAFTGTRELLIGLLTEDRSRAAVALKDAGVTLALLDRRDAMPG